MSKFKVGDKAIVTGDTRGWLHCLDDGTRVTIEEIGFKGDNDYHCCVDETGEKAWVHEDDLELVEGAPEAKQEGELDPRRLAAFREAVSAAKELGVDGEVGARAAYMFTQLLIGRKPATPPLPRLWN